MARFKTELLLNKPDSFIDFIIKDYFSKENFVLKEKKGEMVWQNGAGLLTAPQYIKYTYQNGLLTIESWLKFALLPGIYVGELGLTGFVGAVPKASLKKKVTQIISLVSQPLPSDYEVDSTQTNSSESPVTIENSDTNGQPVAVYGHDTSSKATLALVFGILSFSGTIIPLLGIILGALGIVNARKGLNSTKKGLSTAGLVLSILGIVFSALVWIINIASISLKL